MGQYHLTVNLDKKEFIHPHRLGDGLKLMEFGNSAGGTMTALAILLAVSNGRGGGDLRSDSPLIGRWGGDRIAIIGDYAEDGDLPADSAPDIYMACANGEWTDLSADVRAVIEADGQYQFKPTDYGTIKRIESVSDEYVRSGSDPDTVYRVERWSDGTARCTCPGFSFRKTCKHVAAKPIRKSPSTLRPDVVMFAR